MTLTSRKPRPLDRSSAVRDARLIIIATEGQKSEVIYFDRFSSTKVKLRIIPCVNGLSSPDATHQRLLSFKKQYDLGAGDELWLVIDRDRWTPKMISDVARLCKSQRINLAVSNPCFEIWLSFHYTDSIPATITSKQSESFFRGLHGAYNKGSYDPGALGSLLTTAINNAAACDKPKGKRWPVAVGSHVYLLVQSLLTAGASFSASDI